MVTIISESIRRSFQGGERVLVAVSGGVDSISLLHALVRDTRTRQLVLEVAHVDHALRPSSVDDARLTSEAAKAFGLPYHERRLVPPSPRINIEAWGREERYRFFEEVRIGRGLDLVATAHHANDAAETFLMRLFGNRELTGIEERSERRFLVRPFLRVTRSDIEEYARASGLRWAEDPTNEDTSLLRNKVRRLLLPQLSELFGDHIVEAVASRSFAVSEDIEYLYENSRRILSDIGPLKEGDGTWAREFVLSVSALPSPLGWRVVEEALLAGLGFRLGREHSLRVVRYLTAAKESIELPGGYRLERGAHGGITLVRSKG